MIKHIVLDTNAIVSEGFGNSRQFKALLSVSNSLDYTIVVPQPVIDETVARFADGLAREVKSVQNSLKKLSNLMGRSLDSPVGSLDLERETESFRCALQRKFHDASVVVVGYPDTSHEELVGRATSRVRPFNDAGSGYRDTVIWMSVLDLVARTTGRVVLVTADNAFSEKKDGPHLHRQLAAEVARIPGRDASSVALAKDLAQLVDGHIRPSLNGVDWENPIETLATLVSDAEESIALAIQDEYAHVEWDPSDLGLTWEFESPRLAFVEDVRDLTVLDVREYPGECYLVNVQADFAAQFDVFMYKADWYGYDDVPNLFVEDWDWNDHGLMAGTILDLRCTADLLVAAPNGEEHEVQSVTIEVAR